jgi:hypothetical protein
MEQDLEGQRASKYFSDEESNAFNIDFDSAKVDPFSLVLLNKFFNSANRSLLINLIVSSSI